MTKSDLTGKRFGRRVVVSGDYVRRDEWKRSRVLCRCDCGSYDYVDPRKLREGNSGMCLRCAAGAHNPRRKHGLTGSPEWRIYVCMLQRCSDPNGSRYHIYKDASICERWLGDDGFENFLKDMGPKPTKHHSIDRIDNDGEYTPRNCRWATPKQQARNRRNTSKLTVNGVTKTLMEWSEETGIGYAALRKRVKVGWAPEDVVGMPTRDQKPPEAATLTVRGVSKSLMKWAAETGIGYSTLRYRMKRGWKPERIVSEPSRRK